MTRKPQKVYKQMQNDPKIINKETENDPRRQTK